MTLRSFLLLRYDRVFVNPSSRFNPTGTSFKSSCLSTTTLSSLLRRSICSPLCYPIPRSDLFIKPPMLPSRYSLRCGHTFRHLGFHIKFIQGSPFCCPARAIGVGTLYFVDYNYPVLFVAPCFSCMMLSINDRTQERRDCMLPCRSRSTSCVVFFWV